MLFIVEPRSLKLYMFSATLNFVFIMPLGYFIHCQETTTIGENINRRESTFGVAKECLIHDLIFSVITLH